MYVKWCTTLSPAEMGTPGEEPEHEIVVLDPETDERVATLRVSELVLHLDFDGESELPGELMAGVLEGCQAAHVLDGAGDDGRLYNLLRTLGESPRGDSRTIDKLFWLHEIDGSPEGVEFALQTMEKYLTIGLDWVVVGEPTPDRAKTFEAAGYVKRGSWYCRYLSFQPGYPEA